MILRVIDNPMSLSVNPLHESRRLLRLRSDQAKAGFDLLLLQHVEKPAGRLRIGIRSVIEGQSDGPGRETQLTRGAKNRPSLANRVKHLSTDCCCDQRVVELSFVTLTLPRLYERKLDPLIGGKRITRGDHLTFSSVAHSWD